MAIYDTMQFVPCDVSTVCFGTARHGAFLLGAGAPGKRRSLPNARIMIRSRWAGRRARRPTSRSRPRRSSCASSSTPSSPSTGQPVAKVEDDRDHARPQRPGRARHGIIDD